MKWLNRCVVGIGLASLLSDWSHEIATAVLPVYLAGLGVSAAWLGLIEGTADAVSSFAKMGSGYYTDQFQRRKPIAVVGYIITAFGTAAIGLASQAWHVLLARTAAWFGRGIRTPVRKALLAASVEAPAYGRAFGFERMMDTLGAIVGPATALVLLQWTGHRADAVLAITLIPGLAAAAAIALLVRERARTPVAHVSFAARLAALPLGFRRFLLGVGVFGIGDFSHTLLILLAVESLTPSMGAERASLAATALYLFRNVLNAAFAYIAGWLADRFDKRRILSAGYALAGVMGLLLALAPLRLPVFCVIFALGGIYMAIEESLEDALAAELVDREHHGMGFGTLATVNGIGDFLSSAAVGFLWMHFGREAAFACCSVLFFAGSLLVRSRPRE
ncbi:MAG: MFS transporter [Kiritimatiellae bacterium]|nr:MFS transporter [Kiritimatiellia bacterium]MDW8458945.1 MFS transporter [Verrucomicrobiota bacterium]